MLIRACFPYFCPEKAGKILHILWARWFEKLTLYSEVFHSLISMSTLFLLSARLAVKDPGGRPDSRRNKSGRRHKEASKLSDSLKLNKSMEKGNNQGDKSKSQKADKRASARSRR